jgi:hypothetical protein
MSVRRAVAKTSRKCVPNVHLDDALASGKRREGRKRCLVRRPRELAELFQKSPALPRWRQGRNRWFAKSLTEGNF